MIAYEKKEIQQTSKNKEIIEFENIIAESILQYSILALLSENSLLSKEAIFTIIKNKANIVDVLTVNNVLDALWFNKMLSAINPYGEWLFSLTEKGLKTLDAYKKGKEEIILFIAVLLNSTS